MNFKEGECEINTEDSPNISYYLDTDIISWSSYARVLFYDNLTMRTLYIPKSFVSSIRNRG